MPRPDLLPGLSGDKPWHVDKWTARHQMIASLHVAGYNNIEIAAALQISPTHVTNILSDPRAKVVVEELCSQVADRVLDVRARLELYSNEVLTDLVDTFRTTKSEEIKTRLGFGLLDRAGYKPHSGEDSRSGEEPGALTEEVVNRLTEGLEESNNIGTQYKAVGPQDVTDLTQGGKDNAA